MVLPGPARLSVQALTWLLDTEQIGEPHLVLAPTAVWHPPADWDELHAQARAEITALGWYDRRGRLEIEVAVALAIVCRAEVEFFGWITRDTSTIGVLAAGIGRHGLLAVRDGESVWLKHTGPARWRRRWWRRLPMCRRGKDGRSPCHGRRWWDRCGASGSLRPRCRSGRPARRCGGFNSSSGLPPSARVSCTRQFAAGWAAIG